MSFDKDTLKITKYDVLDKLPNPFVFNDGTPVQTPADWQKRRRELYDLAVTMQYGTMPPQPEFLEVEPMYCGSRDFPSSYRIITGTREKPVTFTMVVFRPQGEEKCPVVVSGDLCFGYAYDKEYLHALTDNGIAFVVFNRTELVPDLLNDREGPLYRTYPEYTFSALGAWAWGYARCVDALEKLDIVDMSCIAFTGHSRGGKTAALAGILDERAAIVNPNESGAGGCGCYKLHMAAVDEFGNESRCEQLSDLLRVFPFWMGPEMAAYGENEAGLPFDEHYVKALIAPRVLYVSDAVSDVWANPIGTWQTTQAAKEVYKFLGKEENLLWSFRSGQHAQRPSDLEQLANVIHHFKSGEPLEDNFFKPPFHEPELMFDWRCPEK